MYITDSLDCSDTHKLKKACAVQVETFCVKKKTFAGDELNCFTFYNNNNNNTKHFLALTPAGAESDLNASTNGAYPDRNHRP